MSRKNKLLSLVIALKGSDVFVDWCRSMLKDQKKLTKMDKAAKEYVEAWDNLWRIYDQEIKRSKHG